MHQKGMTDDRYVVRIEGTGERALLNMTISSSTLFEAIAQEAQMKALLFRWNDGISVGMSKIFSPGGAIIRSIHYHRENGIWVEVGVVDTTQQETTAWKLNSGQHTHGTAQSAGARNSSG